MTDTFTSPAPLQTAVLFLVFNRPDTTAQVFEAIRKAKPPRLYVAADGPRAERVGEAENCAKVRELATTVDWPCEVKTLFREENLGCKYAVSGAITWFFEHEEQGIILEDDTLPSQSFFYFCQEMLETYKNNERIKTICGTNIKNGYTSRHSYFFSRYALMWGWASWRRYWNQYELNIDSWPQLKKQGWLKKIGMGGFVFRRVWQAILDKTLLGPPVANWWGYQLIYSSWLNNGITISPSSNLIRNIGFSSDATHTFGEHPILSNLVAREISFPLKHPTVIGVDIKADAFISRHWFGVSWKNYAKSILLKIPGVSRLNQLRKGFASQ
jgi:hypothetical protein